jgi:hypothetical protein
MGTNNEPTPSEPSIAPTLSPDAPTQPATTGKEELAAENTKAVTGKTPDDQLQFELWTYTKEHWGDIGMGLIAACITIAAVSLVKPWVKLAYAFVWEKVENVREGLADKTENALVQTLPYLLGTPISFMLGFGKHFKEMTGSTLDVPSEIVLGGLATGAGAHLLYMIQARWEILDSLEVRWQRLIGVSKADLDAARTQKTSPEDMATLRAMIAEQEAAEKAEKEKKNGKKEEK